MPQLLTSLGEAGITDDTLSVLVGWPSEQVGEFFEELIRSKVLDRLHGFIMKRELIKMATIAAG
jgi:hypothetical protein